VENGIVEENIALTIAVTAKMADSGRKVLYVRILVKGFEAMLKLSVFKVFMRYRIMSCGPPSVSKVCPPSNSITPELRIIFSPESPAIL
jgi:hypothetical protein